MNFEDMIEHGAPAEFTAQTVNGTAKWAGTGWNQSYDFGARPQAEPRPAWPKGRSNRTGE